MFCGVYGHSHPLFLLAPHKMQTLAYLHIYIFTFYLKSCIDKYQLDNTPVNPHYLDLKAFFLGFWAGTE